jgi:hypothetical protein
MAVIKDDQNRASPTEWTLYSHPPFLVRPKAIKLKTDKTEETITSKVKFREIKPN